MASSAQFCSHREQSLQEPAPPCRQPVNADSIEGQSQCFHCKWVLHSSCLKQALTVGSKSPLPSLAEAPALQTYPMLCSYSCLCGVGLSETTLWGSLRPSSNICSALRIPRGLQDLGWSPFSIQSTGKAKPTHRQPLPLSSFRWYFGTHHITNHK